MSMRVAIYAYCAEWGGTYGMTAASVETVESMREAEEIAAEMSLDVIDEYSIIRDYFSNAAEAYGLEEGTEEWDEYIQDCRDENIAYNIHIITKDTDKTDMELTREYCRNMDLFIKEYCN